MPEREMFSRLIEGRFIRWASDNPDIRAAILVGSRARLDHPADEWSDMDILLFAHQVERYQSKSDWIEALAPIWTVIPGRTVMNDPEQLVLFAGGFRTDFVFHSADVLNGVKKMVEDHQIPAVIARGARVLLDKDKTIPDLPPPTRPGSGPLPSPDDFKKAADQFWFQAVYAAQQLRRGEIVPFKAVDNGLKWQLVTLLEWHARSTKGGEIDTWHGGRFLKDWLDPQDLTDLTRSYASCDLEETWQAFWVLLNLYQRRAQDTARQLGYPQRAEWMNEIRSYLNRLYQEH
jgi:aminoglycoside 6-adenylyltransferase